MSSMLGGMMGGGGGGMMGGMMGGGGGGMSALSNLAQVGSQINQTKAAAEGGGSIMNSGSSAGPRQQGQNNGMGGLAAMLGKIFKKPVESTTRVNDTSIAKGLD